MQHYDELLARKVADTSRMFFFSIMVVFANSGLIGVNISIGNLNSKWLEAIVTILLKLGYFLLVVSGIAPGMFSLLGAPWLAHACFRGVNPVAWRKPWEQLSGFSKLLVYLFSVLSFCIALLCVLILVQHPLVESF